MSKHVRLLLISLSGLSLIFAFQNCGEVKFKQNSGSSDTISENASLSGAISLVDQTVFEGQPVQLEAVISQSASNPSFIWTKNGAVLSGVGDSVLKTDKAGLEDQGLYEVIYMDGSTELGRASARLTVIQQFFDSLPVVTTQPQNMSIETGNKLVLSVIAEGSPAPSYQWEKNGYDIPGANSATLEIAKSSKYDSGSYMVKITNSAGTVKSKVVSVAVSDKVVVVDKSCTQLKGTGTPAVRTDVKRSEGYSYTTRGGIYNSCTSTTTCIAGKWVVTGRGSSGQYSHLCR